LRPSARDLPDAGRSYPERAAALMPYATAALARLTAHLASIPLASDDVAVCY